MAYVPPHKRHSNDSGSSSLSPESLIPQFNRSLNPRSFRSNLHRPPQAGKIAYANESSHRWFAVGLADDTMFSSSTHLQPFPLQSTDQKSRRKQPLALVLHDHLKTENNGMSGNMLNNPWDFVAENVQQDLLTAFENLKNEMQGQKYKEMTPKLVASIGRIVFLGRPLSSLASFRRGSVDETTLGQMNRFFHTHLSSSYMDYIITEVVTKIGYVFYEENEIYLVKVFDETRPDSTILCKCSVSKEYKKLELKKIQLNRVRYLVLDMSCLGKNQDLRLMLSSKRNITLPDDEMNDIKSLLSSAVVDPEVRGGLKWPHGMESVGDRYTIGAICHKKDKRFISSSFKLKARHADRFDFRTSDGEVSTEISMKMTALKSLLMEQRVEVDLVSKMLKDNLKEIWESFLCYGSLA